MFSTFRKAELGPVGKIKGMRFKPLIRQPFLMNKLPKEGFLFPFLFLL